MASASPYRSLPVETRLRLVVHELTNDRDARASFIQAMVAKGGGFRPETLRKWPVEQLARTIVTRRAESFGDELRLLQLLYVELEPELQIAFLDACGVKHDNGSISDEKEGALADEATVRHAAQALVAQHGDRGRHYLRTIAAYNSEAWPGLRELLD
ncbi:MAG TPA: hypothetical protein PLL69_02185 [Gemmatimonadales bacterium]|nr:hypothetical protein [Gemmatimonadales bacterium]